MNKTIELIKDHRSIRDFKPDQIDPNIVDEIVKAAQAMPNSINGQQTSIIVVTDKEKKAKVAQLAGDQTWIDQAPLFLLFVIDFYKTDLAAKKNGFTQVIHESVEGTMAGTFDAGLNMGAAIVAAESLGLGIVPIGGIRKSPEEIISLFELPEKVFPVAGLAIGYPNSRSHQKPRLPLNTFKHDEVYQTAGLSEAIEAYDAEMATYLKTINREQEVNWSYTTSRLYQTVYFPEVYPNMKKQGLLNDK